MYLKGFLSKINKIACVRSWYMVPLFWVVFPNANLMLKLTSSACEGFPGSSDGICQQCGRPRRPKFNPWVGDWSLGDGNGTHCSVPGEFHGQRGLVPGYSPWGCKESDMTEQLNWKIIRLLYCNLKVMIPWRKQFWKVLSKWNMISKCVSTASKFIWEAHSMWLGWINRLGLEPNGNLRTERASEVL